MVCGVLSKTLHLLQSCLKDLYQNAEREDAEMLPLSSPSPWKGMRTTCCLLLWQERAVSQGMLRYPSEMPRLSGAKEHLSRMDCISINSLHKHSTAFYEYYCHCAKIASRSAPGHPGTLQRSQGVRSSSALRALGPGGQREAQQLKHKEKLALCFGETLTI